MRNYRSFLLLDFVDAVKNGEKQQYISYLAKDEVRQAFICRVEGVANPNKTKPHQKYAGTTVGTELRTYRIAVAFNGELTDNYGSVSAAMDRVAVIVSDMNLILERDLCITYVLAANNDQLLFTSTNDPYNGSYLGSNTGITNDIIGVDNYDIGLVVLPSGGGVSYVGVTCSSTGKAGTESVNSVLYIAHELGHNMDAGHTFNNCGSLGGSDYEPGSGNPFSNALELQFNTSSNENLVLEVVDISGRVIISETLQEQGGRFTTRLDFSGYPSGVYFVSFIYGGKIYWEKVMKGQ